MINCENIYVIDIFEHILSLILSLIMQIIEKVNKKIFSKIYRQYLFYTTNRASTMNNYILFS